MQYNRPSEEELKYIYEIASKLPFDSLELLKLTLQSVGFNVPTVNKFMNGVNDEGTYGVYENEYVKKFNRYLPTDNGVNVLSVEFYLPFFSGYLGSEKPFDNLVIKLLTGYPFTLIDFIKYPSGKNMKILEKEESLYRALLDMFSIDSKPWELKKTNKETIRKIMNENMPKDASGPIIISDIDFIGTFESGKGNKEDKFRVVLELKKNNSDNFYQIELVTGVSASNVRFKLNYVSIK